MCKWMNKLLQISYYFFFFFFFFFLQISYYFLMLDSPVSFAVVLTTTFNTSIKFRNLLMFVSYLEYRSLRVQTSPVGRNSRQLINVIWKVSTSQVALVVKYPPANQEIQNMWVWSLVQEDPLEKVMATHSRFLAWRIPGQRNLVGYSPRGHKELDMTEH